MQYNMYIHEISTQKDQIYACNDNQAPHKWEEGIHMYTRTRGDYSSIWGTNALIAQISLEWKQQIQI